MNTQKKLYYNVSIQTQASQLNTFFKNADSTHDQHLHPLLHNALIEQTILTVQHLRLLSKELTVETNKSNYHNSTG